MIDIIARAMAVAAISGAGNSYTKQETDQKLAQKQDLINAQNKLSSDFVEFNVTQNDINALHALVMNEKQTEVTVQGNDIKILTNVATEGDDIKFETESVFAYKDDINL